MKKFKFRLQQVLEYRETLKKEKERELALRNMELYNAEEHLAGIVAEQDRQVIPEATVSMAELMLSGDYQKRLREALENQRVLVEEATAAVEAARNAYIEKAIEKEVMETLREKRFEAYKQEKARLERKELNEIAVQRHRRKRKSNGDE